MGEYQGRRTRMLDNGYVRLEVLDEQDARIISLVLAGSDDNLLAQTPDAGWSTPYGRFELLGGHRLWRAPQRLAGTDAPATTVIVGAIEGGVRIVAPSALGGDTKTLTVTLATDRAVVTVTHEVRNDTADTVCWAAWGITQLRLGGVGIVPLAEVPLPPETPEPHRVVAWWPNARVGDPRITLTDDCLLLRAAGPPVKVGTMSASGRIGYLVEGVLVRKTFAADSYAAHADGGCNVELYTDEGCFELESLSPLATLPPGASVVHVETWDLSHCDADPGDVADLRAAVLAPGPAD